MGLIRVSARIITLIFITALLQPVVSAQELSGRIAGTGSATASTTVSPDVSAVLQTATDVLQGKATRGPYFLTWKPISRFQEHVSVDGTIMLRGTDYDIDYTSSMIAFTSPVSASSTIRVDYGYPTGAAKNSSPMNVPLSLNLLKKDNSSLTVLGLYKQGDPNVKNAADTLAYGLSGTTKTSVGDVSSMLLFSPEAPGANSSSGNSFNDRSAMKIGSSTNTGNFQLTTSYTKVGQQFVAAKDYQLQQGLQSMNYDAIFNAGKSIKLSSSFKSNEYLSGDMQGIANSTSSYGMSIAPNLSLIHISEPTRPY